MVALVALVLVPISTQSGKALQERVKETSLIQTHADMAEGLAPWSFVLALSAVLAPTGTIVQAVRVGHSGATATWSHVAGPAMLTSAGASDQT